MSTSDTNSAVMPTSDAKERCDTHPSVMSPANAILYAVAPPALPAATCRWHEGRTQWSNYVMTPTVSPAAIESRIRRAVAKDGCFLRKPRNVMEQREFGLFVVVNAQTGNPDYWTSDLTYLARECGVIRTSEVIED